MAMAPGLPPQRELKVKLCLLGDEAVGKTSLIRRFVHNDFDERYIQTVGAVVSNRPMELVGPRGSRRAVKVLVWDIVGKKPVAELMGEAYFTGTNGVLLVADRSRPETFPGLEAWWRVVGEEAPGVKALVLANKVDLGDATAGVEAGREAFCEAHSIPCISTSAKSGQGVEEAFCSLVSRILEESQRLRGKVKVPELPPVTVH